MALADRITRRLGFLDKPFRSGEFLKSIPPLLHQPPVQPGT